MSTQLRSRSDGYGVLCRSCRLLWFAIWGVLCPSLRAWALASSALPDQLDLTVTHQLADPVRGWRLTSTPLSAGVKVGTHELQCLLSAVLSPPSWWRDGQWADWSPTGWLRDCAGSAQFSSGHARGDISARCVHRYHAALSQWNFCPASAAVVKEVLSYQLSWLLCQAHFVVTWDSQPRWHRTVTIEPRWLSDCAGRK